MEDSKLIQATKDFVQNTLAQAEGGHDWWHIYRVYNIACKITRSEKADTLVVQLSALLHDIADSKFNDGNEEVGPLLAERFLRSMHIEDRTVLHVKRIIENISFKGGKEKSDFDSIELQIVQDADRLDALGAIGIARAFNYGGFKGRELYNPLKKPNLGMSKEEYKAGNGPTLNHFYEKLLLLKDRMNTKTGKEMAQQRHDFMLLFLKQFYEEWGRE